MLHVELSSALRKFTCLEELLGSIISHRDWQLVHCLQESLLVHATSAIRVKLEKLLLEVDCLPLAIKSEEPESCLCLGLCDKLLEECDKSVRGHVALAPAVTHLKEEAQLCIGQLGYFLLI